jgi:cytochrome c oxidase subunit II
MFQKPILAAMIALALTASACKLTSQPVQSEKAPEVVQVSGEELYQRMGCVECHTNGAGVAAPTLEGLYGGMVLLDSGETILADEAYLRESILFPNTKIVQGYKSIMPSFQERIAEEQVKALVEYIRSLAQ